MLADVAFPIPYERYFTYIVPAGLESSIIPGSIITAPLGRKPAAGIVLHIKESDGIGIDNMKEITALGDPGLSITSDLLELMTLTSERYGTTPGLVAKAILPPGTLQRKRLYLYPGSNRPPNDSESEVKAFVDSISANPGRFLLHDPRRPRDISLKTIDSLVGSGVLTLSPFKTSIRHSGDRYLRAAIAGIPDGIALREKSKNLLEKLIAAKEAVSVDSLENSGISTNTANTLARKGLIEVEYREKGIGDIGGMTSLVKEDVVELTLWQRAALQFVEQNLNKSQFKGMLLFGVTSSGKTQVYLEAARMALDLGKSVLVLVPEISLTPQIVSRFERFLGIRPLVWHSHLTPGEKARVYKKARSAEIKLIIGARSAIFSPLRNLGLIVVDEEQDGSYKQDDPAPRYNARDLALVRGRISNCAVILGSATPSMESFQLAKDGALELRTLPQRVAGKSAPKVEIISTALKKGTAAETRSIFPKGFWPVSDKLYSELSIRMKNKEQAIILLNRRGYSSSVVCFDCGWLGKCPDCEIGWTYHKSRNKMICHFCGAEKTGPTLCPSCGSSRLSFRGAGTERLKEVMESLFPSARIKRLDSDAVPEKWGSRDILDEFGSGKIDLLLGTQMVAKGHHFPSVGFVGVIGADIGLSLPDFRASERVLQLLMQAVGRAGRSSKKTDPGLVMVQTFTPEHKIFGYLINDDYAGFIDDELEIRKVLKYPPFARLMLIEISSASASRAHDIAVKIKNSISDESSRGIIEILGPARSSIFKRGKMYRYQLLLKLPVEGNYAGIIELIDTISRETRSVKVKLDIDPNNFL